MISHFKYYVWALLFFFSFADSLWAREPFHALITVAGDSARVSDPNLIDLSRQLKQSAIQKLLPNYTPTSQVSLDLNLRGIDSKAFFPANSTILTLVIPQAGITEVFAGATRNESLDLMREYLRNGARKRKLLKAYYRHSPIDPIAGNPDSLLSQMGQADYALGRLSPLSGCSTCWSAQPIVHQYQVGFIGNRAFSKGFETTTVTMPLRYSYSPDLRWAFVIDAPFTYFRNGGASSMYASIGMGVRVPVNDFWSVTPVLRLGTGGTLDLCTAGNFVSMGLTSEVHGKWNGWVISMTNYASYDTSANFWLTGLNFNYKLQNYTFKNGIWINSCEGFTLFQRKINLAVSFVDTLFSKKDLYISHYDEVGLWLITNGVLPAMCYDCLVFGFSARYGQKKYKGMTLDLSYQF